ncbi:hypothetical protein [Novosphingobium sp. 9]|uniref:hypothetical protein n=1 Tax=Novosphingobium sp. 9 TaxID=2025349 RepID=UPI0021B62761|nr:hypothetical protein [Novosphingobium sp. 9]
MLTILLLSSAIQPTPITCEPLHGGPAEGMCLAPGESKSPGAQLVDLLPARTPPALDPARAVIIRQLLAAHRTGADIPHGLVDENATQEYCTSFSSDCLTAAPLRGWRVDRHMIASAPYPLPDGSVRIEWSLNGRMQLLSYINMMNNKITSIRTAPAQIPLQFAQ